MTLHDKIMRLPCDVDGVVANDARLSFKLGHKQARHAAAELAVVQDAVVAQLVVALFYVRTYLNEKDWPTKEVDAALTAFQESKQ